MSNTKRKLVNTLNKLKIDRSKVIICFIELVKLNSVANIFMKVCMAKKIS